MDSTMTLGALRPHPYARDSRGSGVPFPVSIPRKAKAVPRLITTARCRLRRSLPLQDQRAAQRDHAGCFCGCDSDAAVGLELLHSGWDTKYSGTAFCARWTSTRSGVGFFTGPDPPPGKCRLARSVAASRLVVTDKGLRELIVAPRREHSRKPDEQYGRIQRFCDGPYVELFARSRLPALKLGAMRPVYLEKLHDQEPGDRC